MLKQRLLLSFTYMFYFGPANYSVLLEKQMDSIHSCWHRRGSKMGLPEPAEATAQGGEFSSRCRQALHPPLGVPLGQLSRIWSFIEAQLIEDTLTHSVSWVPGLPLALTQSQTLTGTLVLTQSPDTLPTQCRTIPWPFREGGGPTNLYHNSFVLTHGLRGLLLE